MTRPWDRGSRSFLWLPVLAVLLLFGSVVYLTFRYATEVRASQIWLAHSHDVMEKLGQLRIQSLTTSVRVTHYVQGFGAEDPGNIRLAIGRIPDLLGELRALAADDPAQVERVDRIGALLAARTRLQVQLLDRVTPGDIEAARPIFSRLNLNSDPARAAVAAFLQLEQEKLAARQDASDRTLRQTIWTLVALCVGAFSACVAALLLFVSQQRLQRLRLTELATVNEEIRRQNEAVHSSQRRLNAILDNGLDGIMLVAPDGMIILANRAAVDRLGVTREEIVGRQLDSFLPGLDINEVRSWRHDAVLGDGSTFPAEVTIGPCQLDKGPAYVCIMRDVSERQRLEQVKDDFVSTVSHELRTPLTSIRGSLGLIASGAAGELPPKARGLLDIAHKNTVRLIDLVNDLLDIEKIETHRIEMQMERLDLGQLVAGAVEANQGYARQFGVTLALQTPTQPGPDILGQSSRLQQVVTNLLSNAVKFSPKGASVEIQVGLDNGQACVWIRDFGPGIPASFMVDLFKRFAQADTGDTRRSRGTGLGLSIAKAIVERHGGAIGVESPLPDGGTRFWFTLPLAGKPSTQEAVEDNRPRVLVVEDDALAAMTFAAAIAQDGWRTTTVGSAEEALTELAACRFAALTVDLGLPAMSGIDLIRVIDADERHRSMPIIVISADSAQRRAELGAEEHRVVGWLKKPITEDELRRTLGGTVHGKGEWRILHVEDEPDMAIIVREVVHDIVGAPVRIDVAPSLMAARELLGQRRFDLVILDVQLPDGNGLDLVPLLRTTNPQAALLILSAEDMLKGGYAMIQASLTKARMDNAQLADTIRRLVAQARQRAPKEDEHAHPAAE